VFLEVLTAAALDISCELRSRLGVNDVSLETIVSAIESLVVRGRCVHAVALLGSLLVDESALHIAKEDMEGTKGETALKTTTAVLRSILKGTTHHGVRDLSAAVLQHLDPPAEKTEATAFLCDLDLCLDHISFPADGVATKETRAATLAYQGISPEEDAAYGRKIFLALQHLHAQGVPIIVVTRNSEANAWFVLREVARVPTPWIQRVLSAYDAENTWREEPRGCGPGNSGSISTSGGGGRRKKVHKWELIDSYFASQQWVSTRTCYSELPRQNGTARAQSPRVTRAVFVDDSPFEIQCMQESPLTYVSCVKAWRPGKTPAGKKSTYADAKALFGCAPGLFNHQEHVVAELWEALLPGSVLPTGLFND
jgi:hypothetical protein